MLSRVVPGFPKPLECTDSFLTKSRPQLVLNGVSLIWYSISDRYPLRDCLNLSSLALFARHCLRSARLFVLCFLLLSLLSLGLTVSFFLTVLAFFPLSLSLFSIRSWLKPRHPWLFAPSSAPSDHLLLFAWSSLPLCHRQCLTGRWPLILSWTAPALPQRFGISVTLWNDSSANSVVKSDFRLLYVTA